MQTEQQRDMQASEQADKQQLHTQAKDSPKKTGKVICDFSRQADVQTDIQAAEQADKWVITLRKILAENGC
jgi:hypothetical protein